MDPQEVVGDSREDASSQWVERISAPQAPNNAPKSLPSAYFPIKRGGGEWRLNCRISRELGGFMSPNVMFWFVPWAAVTTVVLVLLVWRLVAGDHDTIRIAPENPRVIAEEVQLTRKLARLDFWGKAFTVAS